MLIWILLSKFSPSLSFQIGRHSIDISLLRGFFARWKAAIWSFVIFLFVFLQSQMCWIDCAGYLEEGGEEGGMPMKYWREEFLGVDRGLTHLWSSRGEEQTLGGRRKEKTWGDRSYPSCERDRWVSPWQPGHANDPGLERPPHLCTTQRTSPFQWGKGK